MPKLPLERLLTLLLDNLVWNKFGKNLDMEINLELHIPQQSSRGILRKSCSENMQKIYKRTTMGATFPCFATLLKSHSPWVFSRKFVSYFQNTFF